MSDILYSLKSIPVEVSWDSPTLNVGMKVFAWDSINEYWDLLGPVVPVYNVGDSSPTYGAIFVPPQANVQYIVELAVYTDDTLTSYFTDYTVSSHSFFVDSSILDQINSLILGSNNPVLQLDNSPISLHSRKSKKDCFHESEQNEQFGPEWGSASEGAGCKTVQRTIVRGGDTYIDINLFLKDHMPFNTLGASEIEVRMLMSDGVSILSLFYSLGQVAIVNGPLGKERAFLSLAQSQMLNLGIGSMEVKVTINGKTAAINGLNVINVVDELFPIP